MKRQIFTSLLVIVVLISYAQSKVDKEIIELKKVISITPIQEQQFRDIYQNYFNTNDSLKKKESNKILVKRLYHQNAKLCQDKVITVLNEQQQEKYISYISSSNAAGHKIVNLSKNITLTLQQQKQILDLHFATSLTKDSIYQTITDPTIIAELIKQNAKRFNDGVMQILTSQQKEKCKLVRYKSSSVDKKIEEIDKIVTLDTQQQKRIQYLYSVNAKLNDSIAKIKNNPDEVSRLKHQQLKRNHEGMMNSLSDDQKLKYVKSFATPGVMERTEAKITILRETNKYSEAQLENMKSEIFNFLIMAKLVYIRDKYDETKLRDNLHKLKPLIPSSMKEADKLLQIKAQGRIQNGSINW